jgi:hypothetical protein
MMDSTEDDLDVSGFLVSLVAKRERESLRLCSNNYLSTNVAALFFGWAGNGRHLSSLDAYRMAKRYHVAFSAIFVH